MITDLTTIDQLINQCKQSSDFKTIKVSLAGREVSICYYKTLIYDQLLQDHVILAMQNRAFDSELGDISEINIWIPIDDIEITDQVKSIQSKLLKGYAAIRLHPK